MDRGGTTREGGGDTGGTQEPPSTTEEFKLFDMAAGTGDSWSSLVRRAADVPHASYPPPPPPGMCCGVTVQGTTARSLLRTPHPQRPPQPATNAHPVRLHTRPPPCLATDARTRAHKQAGDADTADAEQVPLSAQLARCVCARHVCAMCAPCARHVCAMLRCRHQQAATSRSCCWCTCIEEHNKAHCCLVVARVLAAWATPAAAFALHAHRFAFTGFNVFISCSALAVAKQMLNPANFTAAAQDAAAAADKAGEQLPAWFRGQYQQRRAAAVRVCVCMCVCVCLCVVTAAVGAAACVRCAPCPRRGHPCRCCSQPPPPPPTHTHARARARAATRRRPRG
jgi:hypothetical protein